MNQKRDEHGKPPALSARAAALHALAVRVGVDLDQRVLATLSKVAEAEPHALVSCARDGGLAARAMELSWGDLLGLAGAGTPTMLLLRDGGAALLDRAGPDGRTVFLLNPLSPGAPATAVDEQQLGRFWLRSGIVIRSGHDAAQDAPFGMRWILATLRPDVKLIRDVAIASVIVAFMALLPALAFMQIADRVLVYQSVSTLVLMGLLMALGIGFEVVLWWAKRHLAAVLAQRIEGRLSIMAMQRLLRLPLEYFERTPAGEIQSRVFQIYQVRDFVAGAMFRAFLDVTTLLVVLPFLFMISVPLTLMILGLTAVLVLLMVLFRPAIAEATARVTEADRAKAVALIETVQGMRTVKALAIEPQRNELWNRNVGTSLRAHLALSDVSNQLETISTPVQRLFQQGVMVFGAALVLTGSADSSIGALFAFVMLSGRAAAPLQSLVQLLHGIERVRTALGEASAVLNSPPERPANATGIRPEFKGRVSFGGVSFTYPGSPDPVIRNLSFEVPQGTVLGIVGRSGSGKSTVTRLIQALNGGYQGLIKIDGIEMREMDLPHLRRNLGVVLQENFMFRGTIRENIIAGRPGINLEKVIQACRLAGAEEFIERLPRSYETVIEEGSPNLSGGQKQRLAIARALVTDPAILIFDEATSALDPESEAIVNANLLRICQGRTMIVVSHRLSSLVEADRILVMERGEAIGLAPHHELLRTNPLYRQLWMQQNRTAEGPTHESNRLPLAAG